MYSLLLEELSPQDDLTDEALLSAEKESKPGCIAVKLVYDDAAVMPPHDVRKEIRLLRRIDHANVSISCFLRGTPHADGLFD